MSLVKWNPHRGLGFFNEFDSIMSDFFNRPVRFSSENMALNPRVDVVGTDKEYKIYAELPGLDKKDIEITMKDDVLTIKGEKKYEKVEETENSFCSERVFGKFERSFRLGEAVDSSNISANYSNGVLELTVLKTEPAVEKSRKIEIR